MAVYTQYTNGSAETAIPADWVNVKAFQNGVEIPIIVPTGEEINGVFGYRTSMSMKNKDTWEFAHRYCGKIWYICGLITLPITVVCMLFLIGKDKDVVGTGGAIIMGIQLVPLIGSIFPTEIALRKSFDKNGERK